MTATNLKISLRNHPNFSSPNVKSCSKDLRAFSPKRKGRLFDISPRDKQEIAGRICEHDPGGSGEKVISCEGVKDTSMVIE